MSRRVGDGPSTLVRSSSVVDDAEAFEAFDVRESTARLSLIRRSRDSIRSARGARGPARVWDGRVIAGGRPSARRTHQAGLQGGHVHDRVFARGLTRGPGGGRRVSVLSRKHVCLPGGSREASASEAGSPQGWTRRRSSSPQHSMRPHPTLTVGALGARPGVAADASPPKGREPAQKRAGCRTR